MKKLLITLATFAATLVTATATPVCVQGTLASYIALGAGGCQIDDKIFANFVYQPTAVNAVAPTADQVNVAPLPAPPGGQLNPGPGISFASGGWTVVGPDKFIDSAISFTVTIAPGYPTRFINDASIIIAGNALFGGFSGVGETVVDATNINNSLALDASIPSQPSENKVLPKGPTKTVLVTKDIIVTTFGGQANAVASLSIVQQRFSQIDTQIPEPATAALAGLALLGLGLIRRRIS